jgi:hypothetical protein
MQVTFAGGPPVRPTETEDRKPNLRPINLGELFARVHQLEARVAALEAKSEESKRAP